MAAMCGAKRLEMRGKGYLSDRPHLIIAFAAIGLALLVGLAVYIIMQTYYETQPFWAETAPHQRQNLMFMHLSEEHGRLYATWQAVQFNDRHLLRVLLLLLAAPGLMAWPHAHLLIVVPALMVFLLLFGWTVYRRSDHIGYSIAAIALFCALPGVVSERWGIGMAFADFLAALLLGSGALCLLNAAGQQRINWIRWSAIFLSLGILTRMPTVVTTIIVIAPMALLYLVGEYQDNRSMRSVFFAGGLHTLRDGRQLGQALMLSGLAWTVAGTGTMFWVKAFHLPTPWYAGFFVLAVINLGGAIPSSPGAIGVYHFLAVLALSVWITDKSVALGYAVGTHGVNMLVNTVIGSLCLAREGINLRSLGALPKGAQESILLPRKGGD